MVEEECWYALALFGFGMPNLNTPIESIQLSSTVMATIGDLWKGPLTDAQRTAWKEITIKPTSWDGQAAWLTTVAQLRQQFGFVGAATLPTSIPTSSTWQNVSTIYEWWYVWSQQKTRMPITSASASLPPVVGPNTVPVPKEGIPEVKSTTSPQDDQDPKDLLLSLAATITTAAVTSYLNHHPSPAKEVPKKAVTFTDHATVIDIPPRMLPIEPSPSVVVDGPPSAFLSEDSRCLLVCILIIGVLAMLLISAITKQKWALTLVFFFLLLLLLVWYAW